MAKSYRPLLIPAGVEVKAGPGQVTVKGKLGTLTVPVLHGLKVNVAKEGITVESAPAVPRAMVGTLLAHLRNMFHGVLTGYQKTVELRGMGYRAQKTKEGLQFTCGFSHPVVVEAPAGVTFDVTQVPNPDDTKEQMFELKVSGIDKQLVGHMAATIRSYKTPDPYHGKGLRYKGERVRKKAGKRAAATQA